MDEEEYHEGGSADGADDDEDDDIDARKGVANASAAGEIWYSAALTVTAGTDTLLPRRTCVTNRVRVGPPDVSQHEQGEDAEEDEKLLLLSTGAAARVWQTHGQGAPLDPSVTDPWWMDTPRLIDADSWFLCRKR